jgi:hypothetical protein
MPHSSTQRRRIVTAFLRRGSMPAHAMSREGCVLALDGDGGFAERQAEVVDEHHGLVDTERIHLAKQQLAFGIPHRRKILGGELLCGQLLTAIAADVDAEMRGERLPERLREPLPLHQVVMRINDDGHETAGSLP